MNRDKMKTDRLREKILDIFADNLHTINHKQILFKNELPEIASAILSAIELDEGEIFQIISDKLNEGLMDEKDTGEILHLQAFTLSRAKDKIMKIGGKK